MSSAIGWDYDKNEIQTVLLSGKIFGHKNYRGEIVSSSAIIPYGNKIAYIGMVIVHPKYRGQGLAKEATQKCIDFVESNIAIMLIATEEGVTIGPTIKF